MGGELAQESEWSNERSLDWHLLEQPEHRGVQSLVRDINRIYRERAALWELDDDPGGFSWLESNDLDGNTLCFIRAAAGDRDLLVCACNFNPAPKMRHRIGLPLPGRWVEALNSDSRHYGGGDVGNLGGIVAEPIEWHGQRHSAELILPPLAVVWFVPEAR